ncbi:hypothetical protein MLD38_034826 [Melastoma candidum]|uniref:Uncharacterized protein n=1 Tax=Melastoma candidum TaxID=119954 RepID=A0ACB9MD00_9MYRT|nr:hypothetical protein MLD38_034826 [Melastoma candidum]
MPTTGTVLNRRQGIARLFRGELGLSEELVVACEEMGMVLPSEVMCVGIPDILKGSSLVVSSRSGIPERLPTSCPCFSF